MCCCSIIFDLPYFTVFEGINKRWTMPFFKEQTPDHKQIYPKYVAAVVTFFQPQLRWATMQRKCCEGFFFFLYTFFCEWSNAHLSLSSCWRMYWKQIMELLLHRQLVCFCTLQHWKNMNVGNRIIKKNDNSSPFPYPNRNRIKKRKQFQLMYFNIIFCAFFS